MSRGFTKLLQKLGVSGRTGQPALPSREGSRAELEGQGAASPWRPSTSHARTLFHVIWRRFVSQMLPHRCLTTDVDYSHEMQSCSGNTRWERTVLVPPVATMPNILILSYLIGRNR